MTLHLDKWQKEVLEYRGDFILCTGRQIGKTTIMAIKAAKRMLEKQEKIIIVSLSEDQAKLIISMILSYLEANANREIKKGRDKPTQNRIILKNGSTAIARPVGNTGDAIRGFTGTILIIDEGSRFPELAFTAGEPTLLSTGGEIWMASTPHGKQGYFWEQYNAATEGEEGEVGKENEMGWKVWKINGEETILNRPISPSWNEEKREKVIKRLANLKKRWSALRYGQEIQAEFMDDLRRFFEEELIEKCCTEKRPMVIPEEGNYMGVDIARMGDDRTTYEIFTIDRKGKIIQIENRYTEKKLTTATEQQIIALAQVYKLKKIGIDAGSGSLGVGIYDHLLAYPETRRKVVPMNNRSISLNRDGKDRQRMFKEDLYDNLKSMMEHGEIKLLDDAELKQDLRNVQFEFSNDEKSRVSKVKIFANPSADIVEGLTRGAWLAKKEKHKNIEILYI